MKKRLLILPLITLLLINFASAGLLTDTFDIIGIEDLILVIIFLGSFTLSYFSLNKIFRNKDAIAGIMAFLVALGITGGISYSGFNIAELFYGWGIDEAILFPIVFIILLVGIVFFIWKYSFATLLMMIGFLIFALSWISYEEDIMKIIGGVIFIIGAFLWFRKKKDPNKINQNNPPYPNNQPQQNHPNQQQEQKRRSIIDLKQKYMSYVFSMNKFRGSGGLSQDHRKKRIKQVMRTIIETAKKQGISESDFLSNKTGGSNAKRPEDYA